MAEPVLILHVGPHKTGSTALQYRLLQARAYLQAHGYDYPVLGIAQFAHHRINAFLANNTAESGDVTEETMRGLVHCGTNIILSSEDFIYLSPEKLQRMKQLFEGFRIEVVLFVRTPVDLWPSHWQELVKHGRDETLLDYLGAYFGLTNTIDARFMHPVTQSNRFGHAFGRDALRLFCYDNLVEAQTDIFDFFLEHVLHLPPQPHTNATAVINRSLRADTVELLRSMNDRYRERTGQQPRSTIMAAFHPHQKEIEAGDHYGDFRAAFEKHARTITLDSENDLFRNRERLLLNTYGDRIENAAGGDKVWTREYRRSFAYGARYWADRFGGGGFIDDVLTRLAVMPT